uniref:Galectin n=1 Tax=Acanthochromis polyacanthus TaxID=80966 RepID=A0A3Q1EFQ6_9TELE
MSFNQQSPFYNPRIPFTGSIHGGLQEGQSISISGRVLPRADRFHVNLQCGSRAGADIALHINPRYEGQLYVVNNTFQYGSWGAEERKYNSPFPAGSPFSLLITVSRDSYQLNVNGIHFADYRHRLPFQQVDTISVAGKVEISSIVFQNPVVRKHHNTANSILSLVHYNDGCNYINCKKKHSMEFVVFHVLYISSQVTKIKEFHVNLSHQSGIALHYNPRFNESTVVRNSKTWDQWGPEERGGGMPFQRGQPFTVCLTSHSFRLVVNGMQAHNYKHRFTQLQNITTLEIEGDVSLTSVNV